jgi:N-acetylneuraminic acid mutarotase
MSKRVVLLLVLALLTSALLMTVKPTQSSANLAENSWATKASTPFAGSCEAAVVNGKIYVIKDDRSNASTYEYDPETDTWTGKKPMPTPRSSFALAACQNKIYVIGGTTYTSPINGVSTHCQLNEVYDPETEMWETKEPMPTARSQMRAEAVNGKIYVISGRTGEGLSTVKTTEVYDPATDSWETKADIPYHVSSGGSTVLDDKIYVVGGQNEYHDPMNPGFVQIYDPAVDAWKQGTPHPSPAWLGEEVAATTGLYAPKRIYVMGGYEGFGMATDANYVYDPELDVWTVGASMPLRRVGFALVVVDDLLYAIGGSNGWTVGYSENLQYTPFGHSMVPPVVSVISPSENRNYTSSEVSLVFTVNKPVNWTGYSLDGEENVTVTGNFTLTDLSSGLHHVMVYANDTAGNMGVSETIKFTIALVIHVLSPERRTYDTSNIPLNFTVNSASAQITYCLNGEKNSSVSGNTTLTGLANGEYALTVYAKDEAGNVGASETILFTVDVPFPTTLVIASIASVAIAVVGLLFYFKKRKKEPGDKT